VIFLDGGTAMNEIATVSLPATANQLDAVSKPASSYNLAIGYLRAFITVLVLAHHAVLAYHPFAPPMPASLLTQPRWWQAFPVVDSQRWIGFALFVGFNDTFFMSLMFFLSGLFVWQSLERRGSSAFLRNRVQRLGLPFVVAAALVAPLAYYPSYLLTGTSTGLAGFWHEWRSLGDWPAGPAWFVWVLLAFDCIAAALLALIPKWGQTLGRALSGISRPAVFFALLVALSALAYIPLALIYSPFYWFSFGPFYVQASRPLHYLVYFFIGAGVGAYGFERGLLAPEGKLARRWILWCVAALVAFCVATVIAIASFSAKGSPQVWGMIGGMSFALSCAASSLAFLAIFVHFTRSGNRVLDSLRDNAYGMYLIHYVFVSWLQYALLKTALTAIAKGSAVFLGTLALSWATTAALRRIPVVARTL
jgi:surface polysaccharide O-acyltransferase-like enzyme